MTVNLNIQISVFFQAGGKKNRLTVLIYMESFSLPQFQDNHIGMLQNPF